MTKRAEQMPKPVKAWAIASAGMVMPWSVRATRDAAILNVAAEWDIGWLALRRQGFRAISITISPRPKRGRGRWREISSAPENVLVETKIHDQHGERNQQPLIRFGRLWFFHDKSMYVYYQPTHWRPLPAPPEAR